MGKRIQVVIGYTIGIAAMLALFASTPSSLGWLQWVSVFMIGFFLYGPQMLIGLCGAEVRGWAMTDQHASGLAMTARVSQQRREA